MVAPLFSPRWLPLSHPTRWGVGLSMACPVHVGCWLEFYFVNPCDGGPVMAPNGSQLYYREGTGLGTISLSPEIDEGEHGKFEVLRGNVVFRLQ